MTSDAFRRLDTLARNLWWTWNPRAQQLFAALDPALWRATNHNPLRTIKLLTPERRDAIAQDESFARQLDACEAELRRYLVTRPWFDRAARGHDRDLLVAYFCAEFAVHESLPQYSGGLGVLAGDHLKSASDLGVPLVGVGLLYRGGFYRQSFRADGSTGVTYPQLDFEELPVTDTGKTIAVPMGRGSIRAKVWRLDVGRVPVYLLDADFKPNKPADRALTRHLYGGDREYRIRQEILLGVGGLIALDAVGVRPTVIHMNEGHAAFAALERLRREVVCGTPLRRAERIVRASNCFTTHTPVAAGHDRFDPPQVLKYIGRYAKSLGLSPRELLGLGRENPLDDHEPFCMTILALNLSRQVNGVAKLHGGVTRRMWQNVYGARTADDVPIGHVTNGIHAETWLAPEARPLYDRYLKPKWHGASPDADRWSRAASIPAAELWAMRNMLRARMVAFVRQRLIEQLLRQGAPIEAQIAAHQALDSDALTIGFARRFATYKRAPLIFHDLKRLSRILNDARRPVQLVFAGKAHPADVGGQAFAQEVYRHALREGFRGRVVLLEDYDMHVGRMLTSGCDVWLNNPLRPQEASGTSGMKPPLHGGINCSILDGWWPEAYENGNNGWAIGDGRVFSDQRKQDAYDAASIYELLERQIVPTFYTRDRAGVPRRWVKIMVASMQSVCGRFNTHRMVGEYVERYYLPAHRG